MTKHNLWVFFAVLVGWVVLDGVPLSLQLSSQAKSVRIPDLLVTATPTAVAPPVWRQTIFLDEAETEEALEPLSNQQLSANTVRLEQNQLVLLAIGKKAQGFVATFSASALGEKASMGNILHVRQGDSLLSAQVVDIKDKQVVLESTEQQFILKLFQTHE